MSKFGKRIFTPFSSFSTILLFATISLFFIPVLAGIFYFPNFGQSKAASLSRSFDDSSQTMTGLLSAALNSNPVLPRGGGAVVIDDNALSPAFGPLGATASGTSFKPTKDQIALYTVEEGDTLSEIATHFGVSVNTIRWANDINSRGTIRIGQELIILPVSGVKYAVKKGDTISSIAKLYRADVEEILNFNIIEAEELKIGQEIIIPGGIIPASAASPRVALGTPARSTSDSYIAPVSGRLTQGLHGRNGVDIGASTGTPVYASCPGSILIAKDRGWNGGYGIYIALNCDDGVQMFYGHLSALATRAGERVPQGQIIGYVGSTGNSTGPHLHFEVRGARNFMLP